ncbi:PREDICTED: F-box/kelch-repeat protein At3g06240-like [Fragaria vesca subsp. vesca]|uniref:F-box/kelch-repeat protein At3g06240-like n=1 Tax=Fragaria vesca subsp. vesca TaxID=101020 RepID=UPI0002C34C5A|nr:PREDICTED: F-box/kelch-repeat protein At3g06240-like [Fragaria vesca subsp. vesca]
MADFRKTKTAMAEHIPEDVMINVLERLPVKSLMRFICVSKRWRFIISDPQFAKSHYKLSCENQTIRRRFYLSNSNRFALDSLDFESPSPLLREVRIPFEQPGIKYWSLRCSCNGLVCAVVSVSTSAKYHLYIWNPSTGFLKRLPDPSFCVYSMSVSSGFFGIGYLSATDDYKIIKPGEMLSLRANVWKKIHSPLKDLYIPPEEGIRVNEALHWFYARTPSIAAFDLATEEFRTMPLPAALKHTYYAVLDCSVRLQASVGGCLCAFDFVMFGGSIDFWVMREYGVADSWAKLFKFNVPVPSENIYESERLVVSDTSITLERANVGFL